MTKSVLKPSNRSQTIALGIVIGTTLFSVITAGLASSNDQSYEGLHRWGLILMLIAYTTYIGIVISGRPKRQLKIRVFDDGNKLIAVPASVENFISIRDKQAALPSKSLNAIRTKRRNAIRVITVRNSKLDNQFLRLLGKFPNVSILDIQGCTIESGFWDDLLHLSQLRHVLAHGAVDESSLKELSYTLPEIKFWIAPRTVGGSIVAPYPIDGQEFLSYD